MSVTNTDMSSDSEIKLDAGNAGNGDVPVGDTIEKKETAEKKILATVEVIQDACNHPNADKLVMVTVLGYNVIVDPVSFGFTMQDFSGLKGITGVMFYPDGVVPDNLKDLSCFSYLHDSHMGKRIRTIKLRGQYSEGLFLPLSTVRSFCPTLSDDVKTGDDVTELTGVKKYYSLDDTDFSYSRLTKEKSAKDPAMAFPAMIPKTDQPHLQKNIGMLRPGREMVATLKIDGQSGTFFYDPVKDEVGMCSRNLRIVPGHDCQPQFVFIEKTLNILEKLRQLKRPLAIQGEIYGMGINNNRAKLPGYRFAVFDVYTWDPEPIGDGLYKGNYLSHREVVQLCKDLDLPMVPVIMEPTTEFPLDVKHWLDVAEKLNFDAITSVKGLLAEGLVLKTTDGRAPYVSCKVISRAYSVKHGLN